MGVWQWLTGVLLRREWSRSTSRPRRQALSKAEKAELERLIERRKKRVGR